MGEVKYRILNEENQKTMDKETSHPFDCEWDDDTLFNYLTFEYPRAYSNREENNELKTIVDEIDSRIYNFNHNKLTKSIFVSEVGELNDKYDSVKGPKGFRSYRYVLRLIEEYETLVIRSPGGMGKSYFVYTIEQKLKEKNIEHLVLYGKTFNKFKDIDCNEIIETANKENFVFVFDAINEIKNEDDFGILIEIINKIKTASNIFIVATYRDSSGFDYRLEKLDFHETYFSGINYNDALYHVQEIVGNVPIEYDEVLRTNNPLYIQALLFSLSKGMYRRKKSIDSLTTLLEDYVKNTVGLDSWNLYKGIACLMFKNKRKYLYQKEINSLLNINNQKEYESIIDKGFLIFNGKYYQFNLDTLTDYLIARFAFDIIKRSKNKYQTIIDLYNEYPFLEEALSLVIIDGYDDKVAAINLIKKSGVYLSYDLLSKIVLKETDIENINKQCFVDIDYYWAFFSMAGIRNKLFNCVNRLHNYFLTNEDAYLKMCIDSEDDRRFINRIKLRLKRNLFIAAKTKYMDDSGIEYLYFAIWSLGLSDKDSIVLSKKSISILVDLNDSFPKETIRLYRLIDNPFIKDGIVESLTASSHKNNDIKTAFFSKLIKDKQYVNAKNIALIERYFGRPLNPCRYNKDNYLEKIDNKYLTDDYKHLLQTMYLRHDIYLCFEYIHEDYYTTNVHFMKADKKFIGNINNKLMKQYSCFENGECCGNMCVGDVLKEQYAIKKDDYITPKRMAEITGYFLHRMLKQLNIEISDLQPYHLYAYSSSVLIRLLKIAESEMLGVLMSNYYIDEFSTYNGYENPVIGFQSYDPLEFESDYYILNAVVPIHSDFVEKLDNKICKIIRKDSIHDKKWGYDRDSIEKEVASIINNPLIIGNEEYYPIAFVCKYTFDNDLTYEYISFRIAIDSNTHLGNGNNRFDYIDFLNYRNNINDYGILDKNSNLCLEISDFGRSLSFLSQKSVILPPSLIVRENNLSANTINSCFELDDKPVIYFNQNVNQYDDDFVKNSVYLRKDIYEKHLNRIRYFGFLERSVYGEGICRDSAIEFETDVALNLTFITHYENNYVRDEPNPKCLRCTKQIKKLLDNDAANRPGLDEFLEQLGYK